MSRFSSVTECSELFASHLIRSTLTAACNRLEPKVNTSSMPLVSVITPVYNNAEHLAACIASVLSQTYRNWDYTIVNNCSTDTSLAIAMQYAAGDPRIRVLSNSRFLPIIENHNHAIRQISPQSKYCKFVFADDWLYPTCIADMVKLAEDNPSVGIVSAYTTDGESVIWQGPPYPANRVDGQQVCRSKLLGGPYIFGTFTSLMLRSDLISKREVFLNERNLHADQEACFEVLKKSDFGFIHQVLSYSRKRAQSAGCFARDFDSIILGEVVIFLQYGPIFLDKSEYRQRWKKLRRQYHRVLAKNLLRIRPRRFWNYHKTALASHGARINPVLLALSILPEVASRLSEPVATVHNARRWWSEFLGRVSSKHEAQDHAAPSPKDHRASES
jgi:glycosyltransferase involved in cell wall biosynthesis